MAIANPLRTVADFERFIARPENQHRKFELIDGILVEKDVVTQEHGFIASNLNGHLWNFLREHKLGRVYVEADAKASGDDRNWRTPDLSVVLDLNKPIVTKGAAPELPDLAVEIKSHRNTILELREKAAFYTKNGTRLVWVILPASQIVEVYRPNADVILLQAADSLDGFDVLPGFTLPVRSLFED